MEESITQDDAEKTSIRQIRVRFSDLESETKDLMFRRPARPHEEPESHATYGMDSRRVIFDLAFFHALESRRQGA